MHARKLTSAILMVLSATALVACSEDDDDNPIGIGNDDTTVRYFNATSGTLNLDVAENATVAAGNGNIAFGSASSCTRVNAANPQLGVRTAGSTTNLPGFTNPTLTSGGTYTVLVTGTATAPVFTTLNDQFTAPTGTNAAVRVINATTSATTGTGTYDIYVNPGATLGTPNASGVARNAQSTYITVPAGVTTNTLRLTNTGSTTAVQNITLPSIAAGQVSTIVITDAAAGSTALRTFTLQPCT